MSGNCDHAICSLQLVRDAISRPKSRDWEVVRESRVAKIPPIGRLDALSPMQRLDSPTVGSRTHERGSWYPAFFSLSQVQTEAMPTFLMD